MLESAVALCLLITLASVAALLRARSELSEERARCAALETVPLEWFRRRPGRTKVDAHDQASGYRQFLARLSAADAERLEKARQALQSGGAAFSTTFVTRSGAAYAVEGRRATSGDTVLWLLDASAAVAVQRARREAADLRQMLDAIPVPVWRRGADCILVDCNRAYASALDTTADLAIVEGRELAAGARHGECRHVVIGGSRRLVEIGEVPCSTGGTIGFACDRTDREAAEAELRRHINAHADVLETIRASVAIYGPDKRLKFFNAAFASMWRIPEDWLATQPSFEEVLERLRKARCLPEAADFRAFKSEQLGLFTSVIRPQQDLLHLPDGRTLLLSISPHPFGGLTFVYEDVSDRLALERSCNTLTKVRRATLDHLFEGIAVYGSDGRLKLHNPAYLALWDLSENDLAGEPHIGEILEKTRVLLDDGSDWSARKEKIISKVTAHELASGPVYRKDGSMLQEATVPLPDGDVLVTYLDVTDTARYERVLRERNEALETAGRLKSEFIANVSHELRTPLNAVIGFADILTNQYFGDLNPRQLDYSRGILQGSQQLLGLINDILDLATIEAGYMVLETGRVEILEMLKTVLALTRERARSRGLDIELSCPLEIGAIAADERRLKQALFNLISNAIKFTPPGGAIRIEAERRENELLLTVADTGIGIPLSDQARMLEKFERGTPRSGAGLGLSLVRSLVELHAGSVTIDSAEGRGTTITCRLPAALPGFAAMVPSTHIESRAAA
ncbi:MAG TPA: ATP-binding protein [Stellaceae bacterium]